MSLVPDRSGVLRLAALALPLLAGAVATTPAEGQLFGAAERAAKRGAARQAADGVVRHWTLSMCKPSRPCPLPEHHAATFTGGSYNEVRLGQDTRLYRVYSNLENRLGVPGERYSYWSRSPATGTQAVIDGAIPTARNGNTAAHQVSIVVPRGTTIYEGKTSSFPGGPVGGGNQVIMDGVRREWAVAR